MLRRDCFILNKSSFSSDNFTTEESSLVKNIQESLSKKVIDIEMLANLMMEKDVQTNNQIPVRYARIIGNNFYS